MPLYRRLPHRGFRNVNRVEFAVVNVRDFQELEGKSFGPAELAAAGVIRADGRPLKVLAAGELTRAVTVSAHGFSASAKAKIEAAGGKAVVLGGQAEAK